MIRKFYRDNNTTLNEAINADARFDNECNVIKVCGGKIIRVDRRVNNDNHESEQIKICDDDYVIDNTGTPHPNCIIIAGMIRDNLMELGYDFRD